MKYITLSAIIMISSNFLVSNALADIIPTEKNYVKLLKELCYTKLSREFNKFSTIANKTIPEYEKKIGKLNKNYTISIPMYDIMTTSDALKDSILGIQKSLKKLNKVRQVCADGLDKYIEKS